MAEFRFIQQKVIQPDRQDPTNAGLNSSHSIILPQKHPRAKRACNACRRGKSRCDGRRPSCSRCASRGAGRSCVYEAGTMKTQQYITFLEDRVLELESRSSAGNSTECPNPSTISSDNIEILPVLFNMNHPNSQTDDTSLEKTDALVMVPPRERKPSANGGSSVPAFLHSISSSIGIGDISDHTRVPEVDISTGKGKLRTEPAEVFSLPPRQTADGLMTKFWTYIHPIFPVLDKEHTDLTYQSLWGTESDTSPKSFNHDEVETAIFNMIFALGCQAGSEDESADHFYQRSREFYAIDAIDLPSLNVVQLFVLTGIYLQSTKFASRCWTIVGMAIRYAQYLGIDEKDEEQGAPVDHDHELQCRVWYSCVILDRLLSLSFNNSSMAPPQKKTNLCTLNNRNDSILSLFRHSITLFEIVNNTLISVYHNPPSAKEQPASTRWWPREQLRHISTQNQALDDLAASLPNYLDPSCNTDLSKERLDVRFQWQSYVFRSRFLYVRILALRPLLLSAASVSVQLGQGILNPSESSRITIEESNARDCCSLCIDTIHHLVAHMSNRLEGRANFARWREFHYAFVCAIAISISRLCYLKGSASVEQALNESWVQCVKILEHYKPRIQSAERAMNMLHRLDARVDQITKGDMGKTPLPLGPFAGEEGGSSSYDSLLLTPLIGDDPLGGLNVYDIDYAWLNSQAGGWGWIDQA